MTPAYRVVAGDEDITERLRRFLDEIRVTSTPLYVKNAWGPLRRASFAGDWRPAADTRGGRRGYPALLKQAWVG